MSTSSNGVLAARSTNARMADSSIEHEIGENSGTAHDWHDSNAGRLTHLAARFSAFKFCHPLEHRANRRGVVIGMAALHRFVVNRLGGAEQWHLHAEFFGKISYHMQVFFKDTDCRRRVGVIVLDHHWSTQLEHPALSGTCVGEFINQLRIKPSLHSKNHRFGGGNVVDRHQQVSDVFHLAAVAEHAEIVNLTAEITKHRSQPLDCLAVAASIEDKIIHLCLRTGTAHSAVEHDVARLTQHLLGALLVLDCECGCINDDARLKFCLRKLLRNGIKSFRAWQACDDVTRFTRNSGGAVDDCCAVAFCLAASRTADIKSDNAPSGRVQIFSECAAHDAETYNADCAFLPS